jgi:hypothetical protein
MRRRIVLAIAAGAALLPSTAAAAAGDHTCRPVEAASRLVAAASTSCGFAQATERFTQHHESLDGAVTVRSPVTGKGYRLRCSVLGRSPGRTAIRCRNAERQDLPIRADIHLPFEAS